MRSFCRFNRNRRIYKDTDTSRADNSPAVLLNSFGNNFRLSSRFLLTAHLYIYGAYRLSRIRKGRWTVVYFLAYIRICARFCGLCVCRGYNKGKNRFRIIFKALFIMYRRAYRQLPFGNSLPLLYNELLSQQGNAFLFAFMDRRSNILA